MADWRAFVPATAQEGAEDLIQLPPEFVTPLRASPGKVPGACSGVSSLGSVIERENAACYS